VVVRPDNKNLRLVKPSILFGDKISQFKSFFPQDVSGRIRNRKNNLGMWSMRFEYPWDWRKKN